MLFYSDKFIKKINLLSLHHLCFSGKFKNFLKEEQQPRLISL